MFGRVAIPAILVVGALVCPASARQLSLLAPALPSPSDVIKLVDTLTKNTSSTTVDVKLGKTVSQGKLLVARTTVEVGMERSSKNWRGKVSVQMSVPTEISYTIDLSELRPEHIRLDSEHRRLVVKMPTPKVEDVTPVLPKVKSENTFKACRFKFCDKDTTRELQNSMLLHDYQARARRAGDEAVAKVREQGRQALEKFLRQLLQGIEIVVE